MTDENENDIVIEAETDDEATPTKPGQPVVGMESTVEPISEESEEAGETAVSTPPPSQPAPAVSQRRGCVLLFLGAILGAVLGTVLTLSILLGLNGSLTFTSTDAQLRRAINDTRIQQEDMEDTLATRSAHIEAMATQVGGLALEQGTINEEMGTVEAGMGDVQIVVTAVSTLVLGLDERVEMTEDQIEYAATAAAEFDAFISGLKELLVESGADSATPNADDEPETDKTPTPTTVSSEQEATGEATSSARATRTPRPTSTTLSLPTSTPEQRP